MRNEFRDELTALGSTRTDQVFLTGDLGYKALEPVVEAFGRRFINAGIAEQNMIGMAAGIARTGLNVWAYSIAPFIYARCFEQIRNDVTFHNLPVRLVGNGGGYGYGVMGPSHHALEDYGILSTLPNIRCLVPAFSNDVIALVKMANNLSGPCYLRLGRDEIPPGEVPPSYSSWRCVHKGKKTDIVVVTVGPIAGSFWTWLKNEGSSYADDTSLWIVSELPIDYVDIPRDFLIEVESASRIVTVEEHVLQGGFGTVLVAKLAEAGVLPGNVRLLGARSQLTNGYGSQQYCRNQSGLGVGDFLKAMST